MKQLMIILLSLLSLMACQPEESPIFSDEKMIDVLIDVHVAEAAMQGLNQQRKDSLTSLYYNQIFEIHSIKEADFYSQMEYMKLHPEYMEKIYEKVLSEITRREAELKQE